MQNSQRAHPRQLKNDDYIVPGVIGDYARAAFAKSLKGDAVCWRLRVDDAENGTQYFLVGMPHYVAYGIVRRGIRRS